MNDPFDRSFRDRVLAGETLLGLFLDLGSPVSAELCAAAGYDWLLVDLEHGAATEADLLGLLHAVEVGGSTALVAAAVRRAAPDRAGARRGRARDHGPPARLGRPGPRGGHVPALSAGRDPRRRDPGPRRRPRRRRPRRRQAASTSGSSGSSRSSRPAALRDADAIAAIDGVDVLFVGPADLSHSLGIPASSEHADYLAALEGSSPPAAPTARRPGSSSTTRPSCRATSSSGSRSSASAPTRPSSRRGEALLAAVRG